MNLLKSQKLLDASSYQASYKDYSFQVIQGVPAPGQKLEAVKDLLMAQIEKLKKGDFDDGLITAIINNLKLEEIQNQENNASRAYNLMDAFATGRSREKVLADKEALKSVTKNDIMAFATAWYKNDYTVVYKRVGEDKSIEKVQKPPITQVPLNRDDVSPFAESILNATPTPIAPVFLDYDTQILKTKLTHAVPLYYLKNTENDRFTLYYFLDMGKDNDTRLPIAASYLQFLGTDKYTPEQVSMEFYKLAASFGVSAGSDRTYVYLTGLQENFDASLELFEHLLHHAKPEQEALDALIANTIQDRENQKMDKDVILNRGMVSYAKFGPKNSFNNNISDEGLKKLKATELTQYLHKLLSYHHKVYYYGPGEEKTLVDVLNHKHETPETLQEYPLAISFSTPINTEEKIYFTNFGMVQANIFWVAQGGGYDAKKLPVSTLFNEYFGGGMGSIVFQTLRESKALAYSTTSRFEVPQRRSDPFFTIAYIGTQADKLKEAITGMNELLHDMPKTGVLLENAKRGLKSQIEAQRIIRQDILMNYDQALRMGNDHDVRKDIYDQLDKLSFDDLAKFHADNCASKKYTYCVLAAKDKINMEELQKYGKVEELTLEQIFGY